MNGGNFTFTSCFLDSGCFGCGCSDRHHKALSADLVVKPGALAKRLVVPKRGSLLASAHAALLSFLRLCTSSAQLRTPHTSRPAFWATLDARYTLLAPWVSSMRRERSPFLEIRPSGTSCGSSMVAGLTAISVLRLN